MQVFYRVVAYLPLIWIAIFLLTVLSAIIQLDHVPVYGHDPSPEHLGMFTLVVISMILFLAFWPLTGAAILLYIIETETTNKFRINYSYIGAFFFGVILFVCTSHFFEAQLLWFFD